MITMTAKSWGRALSERRKALKLTQGAIAQRLGTTQAWVSRVERGAEKVEFGRVLALTKALDLEVDIRPTVEVPAEAESGQSGHVQVKRGPPPKDHPLARVQARIKSKRS